jgi:hypothetical protein
MSPDGMSWKAKCGDVQLVLRQCGALEFQIEFGMGARGVNRLKAVGRRSSFYPNDIRYYPANLCPFQCHVLEAVRRLAHTI